MRRRGAQEGGGAKGGGRGEDLLEKLAVLAVCRLLLLLCLVQLLLHPNKVLLRVSSGFERGRGERREGKMEEGGEWRERAVSQVQGEEESREREEEACLQLLVLAGLLLE